MIDACGQILYIRQFFTENQKPGLDILHRQNLVHDHIMNDMIYSDLEF